MPNIEELRKTDPYAYQRFINAIDTFIRECSPFPAEATALLMENGFPITSETVKVAFDLREKWQKERQAEEERRRKITEEDQKARNAIDVKLPKLITQNDYTQTETDLKSRKTEEITAHRDQLKNRPQFWKSVYHNRVQQTINLLENELRKRKQEQPATSIPKPKKPLPYAT